MSSIDSADDSALRAARRTLVFFVVAVAAVAAGFVLVLTGARGDDGAVTVAGSADSDPRSGEVDAAGDVGPQVGEDVERYLAARRAVLDSVEGERLAVVSLTGYSSVDTVADLLSDLELVRYLVALEGGEPIETRSVDDAFAEVVADAETQLVELEKLAPTVEDPEFSAFYADEIERYRRLLESADGGDVVFGMVVVGSASELRGLGSRASVRLVDVSESARVDRDSPTRGLRPEETVTVGEPPFRP